MTDIDRTTLLVESVVLLFYFVMYGLDRISFEDAVVIALFIIAAFISRIGYHQRSD
jgi:hypothetical protein